MSDIGNYAKSIVVMASAEGARDDGTRLLMVQKLVNECAATTTGPEEKGARLDALFAEVERQLKGLADQAQFVADVEDTIATKKRLISDLAA